MLFVQADSVVHPKAIIRATKGPIVIGERNLIEETALIENTNEDGAPLVIGDDNYVEVSGEQFILFWANFLNHFDLSSNTSTC